MLLTATYARSQYLKHANRQGPCWLVGQRQPPSPAPPRAARCGALPSGWHRPRGCVVRTPSHGLVPVWGNIRKVLQCAVRGGWLPMGAVRRSGPTRAGEQVGGGPRCACVCVCVCVDARSVLLLLWLCVCVCVLVVGGRRGPVKSQESGEVIDHARLCRRYAVGGTSLTGSPPSAVATRQARQASGRLWP
jgi:hypothetical protein